jgi:hypothetical protein
VCLPILPIQFVLPLFYLSLIAVDYDSARARESCKERGSPVRRSGDLEIALLDV